MRSTPLLTGLSTVVGRLVRRSAGILAFLMLVATTETAVSQGLLVTLPDSDPLSAVQPDPSQNAVIPMTLDFGEVQVGTAVSQVFRITSSESTPLQVFGISIPDSASPFEITGFSHNGATSPGTIPPFIFSEDLDPVGLPTFLDVEVTFAPALPGAYSTNVLIHSNDHLYEFIDLFVTGTAVESEPPPAIPDILDFYDMAVEEGLLVGDGPGTSACGRLRALRNMIETAGDLIEAGDLDQACIQLMDAYDRCDGDPHPPDFVAGPAAEVLSDLLYLLLTCEQ